MNFLSAAIREYQLWHLYPGNRMRWLIHERHNPLTLKTFRFGDTELPYFIHPYNGTWASERAVEIPVVRHFLDTSDPSRTLEVGNVLSHYFDVGHTVVDLYETCRYRPVINCDLLEFNPPQKFSHIVSISTVEHIGWEERPRDGKKAMSALLKIRSMLSSGGKAIVTIPVGSNLYLDQQMREGPIEGARFQCMKRVSADNEWVETDLNGALQSKYGFPFMYANAVVFIYLSSCSGTSC